MLPIPRREPAELLNNNSQYDIIVLDSDHKSNEKVAKCEQTLPRRLPIDIQKGWMTLHEAAGLLNRSPANTRRALKLQDDELFVSRDAIWAFRVSVGFEGVV